MVSESRGRRDDGIQQKAKRRDRDHISEMATVAQTPKNGRITQDKLSKEGEWTYEISFNEYNPNSWTQENTTTEKKRFIWRRI